MTNKEELIKWMTETRENLPFEKKTQFLKEFWDKRDRIKDLEQKEQNFSNLENHTGLLLNKELSPIKLIKELNRLKLLFNNANLPNTYALLEEVCQQLLAISQIFDSNDYNSDSEDNESETSEDDFASLDGSESGDEKQENKENQKQEQEKEKEQQEADRKAAEEAAKKKAKEYLKRAEEEKRQKQEEERKQKEAEEAGRLAKEKAEQEKREREGQEKKKQEEVEICFEPIAPVKLEEIKKTTGMMTMITYKMTVEVSERGRYRNEGVHLIGNAWNPSMGMINTYEEDDDPQPGNLKGKPLKKVVLQNLGTLSQDWEKAINKSKVKKGIHRNWKEIFRVKGKIESYDEATATLTFSEKADIDGIITAFPL